MAQLNKKRLQKLIYSVTAQMEEVFDTDHHIEEVYGPLYDTFNVSPTAETLGREGQFAERALGEMAKSFKAHFRDLKRNPQKYLKNIDIEGL